MQPNSQLVPAYLKSKTAQGLKLLMWQNNAKRSSFHNYGTPTFCAGDGYWYAWYYVDISGAFNKDAEDLTDGNAGKQSR
jgi:hypothetical protein